MLGRVLLFLDLYIIICIVQETNGNMFVFYFLLMGEISDSRLYT